MCTSLPPSPCKSKSFQASPIYRRPSVFITARWLLNFLIQCNIRYTERILVKREVISDLGRGILSKTPFLSFKTAASCNSSYLNASDFQMRANSILLPKADSHVASCCNVRQISNGICRYLSDIGNYRRVTMSLREQRIDSRRQFAMTS